MSATLVYRFNSSSRKSKNDSFLEFWYINMLFLEIGILTLGAGWIKLSSTSSVGVASAHL